MVRLLVFCLGFFGALNAWALNAQLDRKSIALGEPLTLSLSGKVDTLEQLNLDALKPEFEVFARTLSRNKAQGTLQVTLYPLRSGKLVVPALGSGADRSRTLNIQVNTSSELLPENRFEFHIEPAAPLVRQPARLTLEICDDGSLEWKRPALPLSSQTQHRSLGEEQIDIERDGSRCTAHRYHWAVLPTQSGEIRFDLPMLEAGKFGQRFRLPPPHVAFNAKPVPGWLPLNVPVGKPMVASDALPDESPIERPLAWRFTVDSGYSIDGLKALIALQLQPYEQWKHYPPTVEALPPEDRNSPLNRLAVTLYALPDSTGPLAVPTLALPYLDPASERLEQIALPSGQVPIYDPFWRKTGQVALVLLVYILLQAALYLAGRELQWRRAKRDALARIEQCAKPAELAANLRAFQPQADAPTATTLRRWLNKLQQYSHHQEELNKLVATVEACHYGDQPIDLAELKRQATTAISRLRPHRLWK